MDHFNTCGIILGFKNFSISGRLLYFIRLGFIRLGFILFGLIRSYSPFLDTISYFTIHYYIENERNDDSKPYSI